MARAFRLLFLQRFLVFWLSGFWPTEKGEVAVTLLHLKDAYQIGRVDNGKNGGFDRAATMANRMRPEVPGTVFGFAADTVSPASNTFKGARAVAALTRLDLATD